jgi:hypothetical protein
VRANDLFLIFAAVWVAVGLGLWFFSRRAPRQRRKRWHLLLIGSAALLFICFCYGLSQRIEVLYMAVPVVVLISVFNHRLTRVCPRCGFDVPRAGLFSRTTFCPRCGGKLDDDAQL